MRNYFLVSLIIVMLISFFGALAIVAVIPFPFHFPVCIIWGLFCGGYNFRGIIENYLYKKFDKKDNA